MRVLFISVAFPPKSDPEALQTAKYFHYLQKHRDLKIDVLTSTAPTLNMPYDKDLEPYSVGADQRIFIKLKENRYFNAVMYRLGLHKVFFPDLKFSFHRQYKKVLSELKEKPDIIYSRSFPLSSAIMAYKLQKALGAPWILHLSDPWADCATHNRNGRDFQQHNEWERECFDKATVIALTSYPTIEFYKRKYPEYGDKFAFFPNVFENSRSEHDPLVLKPAGKFRMVYTGGLGVPRSPRFILRPLQFLCKEFPDIANDMEVILAGEADAVGRDELKRYHVPIVTYLGKISFTQALELQKSANYLVAIDDPTTEVARAMLFLSKLLDYMVAGKRILAITTAGSATDQVVKELNGDSFPHDDVEGITNAIVKAYNAHRKSDLEYLTLDEPPQKYEASYNADRLYDLIFKIAGGTDRY